MHDVLWARYRISGSCYIDRTQAQDDERKDRYIKQKEENEGEVGTGKRAKDVTIYLPFGVRC